MNRNTLHLIKRDVEPNTGVEIAAYRNFGEGNKYVIYKNEKFIGSASEEEFALQIQDMYARIHIFHEDNSNPKVDELIKEMRSKPQDNSFLHEFPNTKI